MTPDSRKIRMILELRRGGITDTRVLSVIERTPRERFVSDPFLDKAYENAALPIGHQQTISQPLAVATMTQALEVTDRTKVLEVGTGSGYQAAILAQLCRRLYTIERWPNLQEKAAAIFREMRLTNITAKIGDGTLGWPEQAPFERIIVTAAAVDVPPILADQLTDDGIMVCPVGETETDQTLLRVRRRADGSFDTEDLGPTRFVPLMEGVAEEG